MSLNTGNNDRNSQTVLVTTKVPEGFVAVLEKGVISVTRSAVDNIIPKHSPFATTFYVNMSRRFSNLGGSIGIIAGAPELSLGEIYVMGESIGMEWRQGGKKINESDKWSEESLVRIKKI